MKKFRFTLQTVHNVREMRQEKEQLLLAQLQSEAAKTAERLAQIKQLYASAVENYNRRLSPGESMNPIEMQMESNNIVALDRLLRETENALEQKKLDCRRQSEKVAAAVREVKITDSLREKQVARYRLELSRREQNALDEMASAGVARKMSKNEK